jgi:putative Holliday junction resolvase
MIASPLTVIDRKDDSAALEAITGIIGESDVRRVIVGLPLNMDGSRGQQAEKVAEFTSKLCRHARVPVDFRDERLSTVSARHLMRASKKSRGKARDDAIAAALILQWFLDEEHEKKLSGGDG